MTISDPDPSYQLKVDPDPGNQKLWIRSWLRIRIRNTDGRENLNQRFRINMYLLGKIPDWSGYMYSLN